MAVDKATPHLLVIDDCPVTCRLLTALLTAEGYRITTAHDGTSGLAAARHHSYDLAIVDLHLPDLSGIEVASLLQPEVPVDELEGERVREAAAEGTPVTFVGGDEHSSREFGSPKRAP